MTDLKKKLSPNFTLGELVTTSHRTIDNTPNNSVIDQLTILCVNYLEPVRTVFGSIRVNSGFRCPELNTVIGGSKTSAHMYGCAVDFVPFDSKHKLQDVVNWIIEESGMPYDQVILESSSTANWIHLGMRKPDQQSPRKENLRFYHGTYSVYDKKIDYGV